MSDPALMIVADAKKAERLREQIEAKDMELRNALSHINRWRRAGMFAGAEYFIAEAAAQSIKAVLDSYSVDQEELP